jgi:asparagine synthase (glutamine-hydrolysing)
MILLAWVTGAFPSLIPVINANQPMKDASGRYRIVYNGEIYNYKALKENCWEKASHSNLNLIQRRLLYAYIHYKEKCLNLLNGFFAFAIYDEKENTLFAARDRYGIKPLYYANDDDKFLFASDMHSILAYGIKKEIDLESLYTYSNSIIPQHPIR